MAIINSGGRPPNSPGGVAGEALAGDPGDAVSNRTRQGRSGRFGLTPRAVAQGENLVAISAEFHRHADYRAFYDLYGSLLGGFPGIWTFCLYAATAFNRVEDEVRRSMKLDEAADVFDGEWIDAIENFVILLYENSLPAPANGAPGNPQDMDYLMKVARQAISRNL